MKLIDKDALVAEIKRLQGVLQDPAMNRESMQDYAHGGNKIIKEILSFLNTIEVKEVDLTEEIYFYIENSITGTNPIYTKGAVSNLIEKAAKHFFELGLKAGQG